MTGARSVFKETREKLKPEYGPEAESLTYIILNELFGLSRVDIILNKKFESAAEKIERLNEIIRRLLNREPVQYIFGKTNFLDRTFVLKPGVLIPRPETEELVSLVKKINMISDPRILDIGSGSGCIAISLALEISGARVTAWDASAQAVEITRKNAARLKAEVTVRQIDIFDYDQSKPKFDILVSNPPYVLNSEKKVLNKNILNHEPHEALFVEDHDPLKYYRRILDLSGNILCEAGLMFFEINEKFGAPVCELMELRNYGQVNIVRDIHGKDRFAWGQKL